VSVVIGNGIRSLGGTVLAHDTCHEGVIVNNGHFRSGMVTIVLSLSVLETKDCFCHLQPKEIDAGTTGS